MGNYKQRKGESKDDARRRYQREYLRKHPRKDTLKQKKHRANLMKIWRKNNPDYHRHYMIMYRLKKNKSK